MDHKEILKKYKTYTLLYTELNGKFIYTIYNKEIELIKFESEDHSAYKLARDYFDSVKDI